MELLDRLYFAICLSINGFLYEEDGAVDIVAVVVLIGIAVVLAVLFRERIEGLIETLLGTIEGSATKAVN